MRCLCEPRIIFQKLSFTEESKENFNYFYQHFKTFSVKFWVEGFMVEI